jgi:hypothetical protein
MKNSNDQILQKYAQFATPKIGEVRNHQSIKFNGNIYEVIHYVALGTRSETTYMLIVKNGAKLVNFFVRGDGHISNPLLENAQFVDTLFIQNKLGFNVQIGTPSKENPLKKSKTVMSANKTKSTKGKTKKKDKKDEISLNTLSEFVNPPKRGRGRPRKPIDPNAVVKPKRGRGRPRKNVIEISVQQFDATMLSSDVAPQPKRGRGRPRKVEIAAEL